MNVQKLNEAIEIVKSKGFIYWVANYKPSHAICRFQRKTMVPGLIFGTAVLFSFCWAISRPIPTNKMGWPIIRLTSRETRRKQS